MRNALLTLYSRGASCLIVSLALPAFAESKTVGDVAGTEAQSSDEAAEHSAADGEASPEDGSATEADVEGPSDADEATEPEIDPYAEAKERVARAEKLYEDGNFDAALTEFARAYETMLGHPARNYVLFNIGKCQEKLYRYDAAINSYRTYLENSGDGAEDKAAVEAKIEILEGLLGTLEVTVTATKGSPPQDYEVWVDGRLIDGDRRRFMIPGGNHQVEIRADGFEIQNKEVQVPARSERTLEFALSPLAEEYKGLPKTYFWAASGLAAAAGVAGGAFGIMTVTKRNQLDQKLPEQVTQDDADSLKNRALTADMFFVGAGVFATSAVILAFITDWSGDPEQKGNVQIKEVGVSPTKNGGYIGLTGSF